MTWHYQTCMQQSEQSAGSDPSSHSAGLLWQIMHMTVPGFAGCGSSSRPSIASIKALNERIRDYPHQLNGGASSLGFISHLALGTIALERSHLHYRVMLKLVSGFLNTDVMNFVDCPECSHRQEHAALRTKARSWVRHIHHALNTTRKNFQTAWRSIRRSALSAQRRSCCTTRSSLGRLALFHEIVKNAVLQSMCVA
jgi:hypothetical protein